MNISKKKKSSAVFVKNLTSGGAEKQAVLLAKALQYDYQVCFVIFHADKVHQKYLDMLNECPKVETFKFYGSKISRFFQLIHLVKSKKIEAMFSYLTVASLLGSVVCKLCGVKGNFPGIRGAYLPKNKARAAKFFTNHLATQIVINSVSGKEYFMRYGCKPEKLAVILNCFENVAPFHEKEQNGIIQYITVGRFMPQKDYLTAIRTMDYLKRKGQAFRYTIVGYGTEEQHIREWIKEYDLENEIKIMINPDNIPELLEGADVYLCTSLYEGTSNAILEAMNANLPIVATDVGDNYLLVEKGKNGYLTQTGDYQGLGDSLMRLNEHRMRVDMGRESKRILTDNYSMESFKSNYMNLLERHGINTNKEK